uniref:Uncharacterized protein n=1 Tax=Globodera rostochiensis TaxID=31243 RepID=A0A914I668_GLORO
MCVCVKRCEFGEDDGCVKRKKRQEKEWKEAGAPTLRPRDISPTKQQTTLRPRDISPTKQQTTLRPRDISPTKQQTTLRPRDISPTKQQTTLRPRDISPTKQQTTLRPRFDVHCRQTFKIARSHYPGGRFCERPLKMNFVIDRR